METTPTKPNGATTRAYSSTGPPDARSFVQYASQNGTDLPLTWEHAQELIAEFPLWEEEILENAEEPV